ncbi:MAG: DUF4476 domain-containing protein [Chitinophagaceae bacterium]|nr:MAG: DUF4476 domain-containing protein [Chitinophagaceae bacterium]
MKTIFTLIASVLLSVSLSAAEVRPGGTVMVKSGDNSKIRVVLDGKTFEPNDDAVIITGLSNGQHSIAVYKQRAGFFNQRTRFDMVYNNSLNVSRRSNYEISVGRNNRVQVQETRGNGNVYNDRQYDYNDGQWGGDDDGGRYNTSLNSRDFDRLLQTIDKEWLESNKVKSATQVVKSNALSTAQVIQLMQLFSFENNKLEVARQAYRNTVDKRNYDEVIDMLTFPAHREELERYLRTNR